MALTFLPTRCCALSLPRCRSRFQVGLSHFRQINADDFHIYVSYEELLRLGSDKYTVKIKNLPKGVSQVRFNPAQVDFLIEQVSPDYGD